MLWIVLDAARKNVGECSCFCAVIHIDIYGSVGHHICGSLIHIYTYIYVVCGTASHYTTASILDVPTFIVRYVAVFYGFYIPCIIRFLVRLR